MYYKILASLFSKIHFSFSVHTFRTATEAKFHAQMPVNNGSNLGISCNPSGLIVYIILYYYYLIFHTMCLAVVITDLYADRWVITNDHGLTEFTVFPSELQYFRKILAVPNNAVF